MNIHDFSANKGDAQLSKRPEMCASLRHCVYQRKYPEEFLNDILVIQSGD